jgi:hypothetical protein
MKISFFYTFLFVIFMQMISCGYAQTDDSEASSDIDTTQIIGSWKLVKTIGKDVFRFERVVDKNSLDIDIVFDKNGRISQKRSSSFWGLAQTIGGKWIIGEKMQLQLIYSNGLTKKIDDSFLIKTATGSTLEIKLLNRKEIQEDCG